MAKVRVQARGADDEEGVADLTEKGKAKSSLPVKRAPKYSGAVDVLRKVFREKGFQGWYQVRVSYLCPRFAKSLPRFYNSSPRGLSSRLSHFLCGWMNCAD